MALHMPLHFSKYCKRNIGRRIKRQRINSKDVDQNRPVEVVPKNEVQSIVDSGKSSGVNSREQGASGCRKTIHGP